MKTSTAAAAVPLHLNLMAWFLCALFACWIGLSVYLESQLGWPAHRADWGGRATGWFVNAVLIRTFLRGLGRVRAARPG
jgi:hypothetical protein